MRRSTKIKSKNRNIKTKDYSPIDRFNYLLLNNNIHDAALLLDDNLTVNTLDNNGFSPLYVLFSNYYRHFTSYKNNIDKFPNHQSILNAFYFLIKNGADPLFEIESSVGNNVLEIVYKIIHEYRDEVYHYQDSLDAFILISQVLVDILPSKNRNIPDKIDFSYKMNPRITKKQKRRQKLTKRQRLNRLAKPESSYYNVYDVAEYNPEESLIDTIRRNPMLIPSLRLRLDSLASLGIGISTNGFPLRLLRQLVFGGYIVMRQIGFENPLETYLESETKHDIHGYCRVGWIERPKKANNVVKTLFDTTNFEVKRSKTGGIMDIRPRKAMLDIMKDAKTWMSYLTQLKSGSDRAQNIKLFEILSSLVGDNDKLKEETNWVETDIIEKLPLKTTDSEYISAITRPGNPIDRSIIVQPLDKDVVTSKDREEFKDSIDMDYDVRTEIYDSFRNADLNRKIQFNKSQKMWAGISLENDSTTFNIVYEWMINESMFNDLIPVKDGKQIILPSFKLVYNDLPNEDWKPSRQQVNDTLPTVYRYMEKNGRCQFGVSIDLKERDTGHAVVLVFEDNKVYACDSNGTPFNYFGIYPYTKIVKNIMNAFIEYSYDDNRLEYGGMIGELNPGCHNTSEFQLYGGVCASWAKYLLLLLSINPHVKTPAIFDYHAIKGYTENYLINRAILIVLYLFEHSIEGLLDPVKHSEYLRSLK